jgi:DtxR family Mn-dependent transcriptional regulator
LSTANGTNVPRPAGEVAGRDGAVKRPALSDAELRSLKALYRLERRAETPATSGRLACMLGVARPSAYQLLQRLESRGLVECRRYRGASLTHAGRAAAAAAVRVHRLLETWLYEDLGMPWERLHAEAEWLQPVVSERLVDRIADRLRETTHCPYGRPIDLGCTANQPDTLARSTWTLAAGSTARIVEVGDLDGAVLRYLAAHELRPSVLLTVAGRDAFGGFITIETERRTEVLGREVASALFVSTAPG